MKAASLLLAACCGCAAPMVRPDVVVSVRTDYGHCNGALVAPGVVLTAAHCIHGAEVRGARASTGEAYRSSSFGANYEADLAEISVGLDGPAIERRQPSWGELVTVQTLAGPIRTHIQAIDHSARSADLAWTATPGFSGSPVFGRDGALVCVVRAYYLRGGTACSFPPGV